MRKEESSQISELTFHFKKKQREKLNQSEQKEKILSADIQLNTEKTLRKLYTTK